MKNIVETAVEAGNFNTLVSAVKKAGLVDTLSAKGPYTVFAPTDEAFSKIPEKTLKSVLKDKSKLQKILTNHVLGNKIMAKDVKNAECAKTVEGSDICFNTLNGVKVENANILKTDINCSNGVIHAIDSVIMPA